MGFRAIRKTMVGYVVATAFLAFANAAGSVEEELDEEIEQLKQRIRELEQKQTKQNEALAEQEEERDSETTFFNELTDRFGTLSVHGDVVGYYQGAIIDGTIAGENLSDPSGFGYVADLQFAFVPFTDSQVFLRLHAGEGDGADVDLEDKGLIYGDLNTLNDNNPGNSTVNVLELYYFQGLLDGKLTLLAGKTEPVVLIDVNSFANDEYTQFVGKPFVNDVVLDAENIYSPLIAIGFAPNANWKFDALIQSTNRPELPSDQQKSRYDDVFDTPFVAAQVTYTNLDLKRDLIGNYRFYSFFATYERDKLDGNGKQKGWGVGISIDQQISDKAGLFARAGYHNEEVYEVEWQWTVGAELSRLFPGREDDRFGIGFAGLHISDNVELNDTELHFEAYYKFHLGETFTLTPDIQYVANPFGDSSGDGIFAGMLRLVWDF